MILVFYGWSAMAQDENDANTLLSIDIPEVAILDLEASSGTNISLIVDVPDEAGTMIDLTAARDSSIWLNYSSVRGRPGEPNRSVYAKITSGSVPSGLRLRVKPLAYSGSGDGDLGVPAGNNGKVLNSNDRRIIKNIKTCYTGDGVNNGHQLVYLLEFRNNQYNRIDFDDSGSLSIMYTISDN